MAQGILPFQYQSSPRVTGLTSLAGLPLYLDLAHAAKLQQMVERHLHVRRAGQGWTDAQLVLALVLLNLAGGDCVEDLATLESDEGFATILRQAELHGLARRVRRALERRWRKKRQRSVPSCSAARRYLEVFHNAEEEPKRCPGKAFIPAANEHLQGLSGVNTDLVAFLQDKAPQPTATLDQDATLIASHKREALYCYKGFCGYQPLNTWWAEQGVVVHSEFRDGNVPAGYEQLRVLQEALACLPAGVQKVRLRSDTAGYQWDLLRYCAEGKDPRFGVIEFAIAADVSPEFKKAVAEVAQNEWQPLDRVVAGRRQKTDQQWAEVCFVPTGSGFKKNGPSYRYLAIRELLRQPSLPGLEAPELPFPTMTFGADRYKVFGVVTNRELPGDELIWWHRQRCGDSEQAHAVMKDDLAGGQLPSGLFGANAAWWQIMVLALNLNVMLKRLALGEGWAQKRMKAVRFALINLPGRVVRHANRLVLQVGRGCRALALFLEARSRIAALAVRPPG